MLLENFLPLYLALFVPLIVWAGGLAWRWVSLPGQARDVYAAQVKDGLINEKVPEAEYVRSYARAERPLLPACLCAASMLVMLLLPLMVYQFIGDRGAFSGWARAFSEISYNGIGLGTIVADFVMFALMVAVIVGVLVGAFFLYYRFRAPSLKSEMRRLEEEYG